MLYVISIYSIHYNNNYYNLITPRHDMTSALNYETETFRLNSLLKYNTVFILKWTRVH